MLYTHTVGIVANDKDLGGMAGNYMSTDMAVNQ